MHDAGCGSDSRLRADVGRRRRIAGILKVALAGNETFSGNSKPAFTHSLIDIGAERISRYDGEWQ